MHSSSSSIKHVLAGSQRLLAESRTEPVPRCLVTISARQSRWQTLVDRFPRSGSVTLSARSLVIDCLSKWWILKSDRCPHKEVNVWGVEGRDFLLPRVEEIRRSCLKGQRSRVTGYRVEAGRHERVSLRLWERNGRNECARHNGFTINSIIFI